MAYYSAASVENNIMSLKMLQDESYGTLKDPADYGQTYQFSDTVHGQANEQRRRFGTYPVFPHMHIGPLSLGDNIYSKKIKASKMHNGKRPY